LIPQEGRGPKLTQEHVAKLIDEALSSNGRAQNSRSLSFANSRLDKKRIGLPIAKPARQLAGNAVKLMDALKGSWRADTATKPSARGKATKTPPRSNELRHARGCNGQLSNPSVASRLLPALHSARSSVSSPNRSGIFLAAFAVVVSTDFAFFDGRLSRRPRLADLLRRHLIAK
jgi:hypothetical protein